MTQDLKAEKGRKKKQIKIDQNRSGPSKRKKNRFKKGSIKAWIRFFSSFFLPLSLSKVKLRERSSAKLLLLRSAGSRRRGGQPP